MKELKIFDNPRNVKILLIVFFSCLAILLVSDIFVHKHGEFPWENKFAFFCAYGFISCVVLVFVAVGLRWLVKREEDYYDE